MTKPSGQQSSERALIEVNFDGLVGPTHHFAGLSFGNVASMSHAQADASPRRAVLQGLAKMKLLMDLGVPQGVLPPQERPAEVWLRSLGFEGSWSEMSEQVWRADKRLLSVACSASCMWAANAATIVPSIDTGRVKGSVVVANLAANLHRSLEAPETFRALSATLPSAGFEVHPSLGPSPFFRDEGAANHTRLTREDGTGVHFFVYGESQQEPGGTRKYPSRQQRESQEAIVRLSGLAPERVVYARQHPDAIDAGVFHNDVIATGFARHLWVHECAFVDQEKVVAQLTSSVPGLDVHTVTSDQLTLEDAVRSYLFNSQIVRSHDGQVVLLAPVQSQTGAAFRVAESWCEAGSIDQLLFVDLGQSMNNGGGPACLRLRVPMTQDRIGGSRLLDSALYGQLARWAETHYRDRLRFDDLRDPKLKLESDTALDELTRILGLGASFYSFQRA